MDVLLAAFVIVLTMTMKPGNTRIFARRAINLNFVSQSACAVSKPVSLLSRNSLHIMSMEDRTL